MNKLTFNISVGLGTALVTAGAAVLWGVGVALILCGVTVLGCTFLAVKVAG